MIWRAFWACIVLVVVLFVYSVYNYMRWQEFAEMHECSVKEKITGYHIMQPTYNPSLNQWSNKPVYYPGHTVYKCNDGKEYIQ